ncbi:hypothetical protein L6452_17559 [Arctium lappa]|uniref:Uncharacterized protein n=1 Tax=Arctium lappa TaxID=4217 RepID=A0ACB9C3R1_ARCLA|nr:hypothetical protein L6452_17559 [Arctium lappa]
MAATVTNAWGKPGAWALDSEEHEDQLNQEKPATPRNNPPSADFPDLMTAAATKTTTKKKKSKPLSLSEFVANKPTASTYQAAKGLTTEDMMMLPTGPRERTAEELDRSRLGGGFRSYGDRNNDSSNSRWGSNRSTAGGGDEGRKSSREPLGYSRADETDDWGAQKKSSVGGFDRKERGVFFEGSNSRADDSDRWVSNKSYAPLEGRRNVRSMGIESSGGADSSDNWGKKKKEEEGRRFGGGGGAFDSLRERRSGNELSDSDNWGRKREDGIGGGSVNRPKLNLQPRKLPVGGGGGDTAEMKTNKGSNSNPFGDARPREYVLEEKGKDWREIDEKLESMKMKEVDGPKRGFRTAAAIEDQSEKSWRKDVSPSSAENSENGNAEGEEAQV